MPKAKTNGITTFYQQLGEGSDIVLIHGLATNRAFWYLQIARALRYGYRVTLYDLRGHGFSDTPASGYTPAVMATDLLALLRYLDIRRATLVGHSYGGAVALSLTAQHPELVNALVLADVRINTLQPVQAIDDSPYLSEFEEAFLTKSGIDWKDESNVGLRFLEEAAEERAVWLRVASRSGFVPFGGLHGSRRTAMQWLTLLRTTTAREDIRSPFHLDANRIRAIKTPTLLIYGERSRCLPTCRALQGALARSSMVFVPRADHFHPVTRPRFFTRMLQRFLQAQVRCVTPSARQYGSPKREIGVVLKVRSR
jgi:pimeloyl-ACP methyl ester carboxylesterase